MRNEEHIDRERKGGVDEENRTSSRKNAMLGLKFLFEEDIDRTFVFRSDGHRARKQNE